MPTICPTNHPPPPPWAGLASLDSLWWLLLLCGALICFACVRLDWPRVAPGTRRRRVVALCVLTWLTLFGSVFLLLTISSSLTTATSTWYLAELGRLRAYNCSTAGLDAAYHQLQAVGSWIIGLLAISEVLSLAPARAWSIARTRYLVPVAREDV